MVGIQTFSKSAEVAVVHVFIISVHCYHLTPPHGSPKIVATSLALLSVAPVWFPDLSKLLYVFPPSLASHTTPLSQSPTASNRDLTTASFLSLAACSPPKSAAERTHLFILSLYLLEIHPFPLFLTQTRTWWSCLCLELEPQDSSLRVTSPGCIWRLESANRHRMSGVAERGCNSQAMLSEVTSLARVALML